MSKTVVFIELIKNPKYLISWQVLKVDFSGCITKPSFDKSKSNLRNDVTTETMCTVHGDKVIKVTGN